MTRKQQIIDLRSQGKKYREIAETVGVSFQYVALVCGKNGYAHFCPWTERDCVYIGLREWINENKFTRMGLVRELGYNVCAKTSIRLGKLMRGEAVMDKNLIDKFIALTGVPYEQLFRSEVA